MWCCRGRGAIMLKFRTSEESGAPWRDVVIRLAIGIMSIFPVTATLSRLLAAIRYVRHAPTPVDAQQLRTHYQTAALRR